MKTKRDTIHSQQVVHEDLAPTKGTTKAPICHEVIQDLEDLRNEVDDEDLNAIDANSLGSLIETEEGSSREEPHELGADLILDSVDGVRTDKETATAIVGKIATIDALTSLGLDELDLTARERREFQTFRYDEVRSNQPFKARSRGGFLIIRAKRGFVLISRDLDSDFIDEVVEVYRELCVGRPKQKS